MKRTVRHILIGIGVLVFAGINLLLVNNLLGSGNGTSAGDASTNQPDELKPKIVIISHVISNPYWDYVRVGAEKAAEERGAVIDFQGPGAASVEEGIRMINMAYAAKADGIIAYVQDENMYNNVIDKIVDGGVPLVTIDSDAENSNRLAYVGTDNVAAGRVGAREMIRQVGLKGKIGIIMGGMNVKNQLERVRGFREYLAENSKLKIADVESSDSYMLEAEIAAKRILVDNWDVTALFCTSALDGLGAQKAVSQLDMVNKVKIVCFDDLPETLDRIKDGKIAATVVQKPYFMGYKAVNIILDNLEGKKVKGKFLTDVHVIRRENVNQYIDKQGDYKQ